MEEKIIVCDKCFQASCWQGIFMCWESQFAGTIELSIEELKKLNLENPCYLEITNHSTGGFIITQNNEVNNVNFSN